MAPALPDITRGYRGLANPFELDSSDSESSSDDEETSSDSSSDSDDDSDNVVSAVSPNPPTEIYHSAVSPNPPTVTYESAVSPNPPVIYESAVSPNPPVIYESVSPNPPTYEKIMGEPASNVSLCGSGCSVCRSFWYSDDPDNVMHECTDKTIYKYSTKCTDK